MNYGYSGYPLVRHMRAMVARGDLGKVRVIVAEFAHGHHADAADADNPRVRWRYDPAQAGVSAQFADCGIHALHMASFVASDEVEKLSADFASTIESRTLEDDAMVNFRMNGGAVGRLWTSSVAVGRMHGLTLQVFGEKGGLRWAQEQPNQLLWTATGGRSQIIERGRSRPLARSGSRAGSPSATPKACRSPSPTSTPISPKSSVPPKQAARPTPPPPSTPKPKTASAPWPPSTPPSPAAGTWVDARPPMFQGAGGTATSLTKVIPRTAIEQHGS